MNGFLLDTCVALWYFAGDSRIPARLCTLSRNPRNRLYFSDVSLLEIVIKHQLGKLPLPDSPSKIISKWVEAHGMEILPVSSATILQLEELPSIHRDPFDRLLICQTLVHELALVTPDPLIQRYTVPMLWD